MLVMVRSFSAQKLNIMRPFEFSFPVPLGPSTPDVAVGIHSRTEASQQDELVARGDILHESVEFLVESVLCLVAAGKSGGACADDYDMSDRVEWEAKFHLPLSHWCWEVW